MKITLIAISIILVVCVILTGVVTHDSNVNTEITNKVTDAINHNATRADVIKIISSECNLSRSWMSSPNECKQFISSKFFDFLEI